MRPYNVCGICKNCKDKPRFGGLGIRKKPCINKIIGSLYALAVLAYVSGFILRDQCPITYKREVLQLAAISGTNILYNL